MVTKRCTQCLLWKNLDAFNNSKSSKDGKRYDCRECNNNYSSKWQTANRDKRSIVCSRWGKNNRPKTNANFIKYYAGRKNRTPKWLTEDQLAEMVETYELCRELQWLSEEPLQVDHVVPLRGENVSGLHVPWNLQILPRSMNVRKSNKY